MGVGRVPLLTWDNVAFKQSLRKPKTDIYCLRWRCDRSLQVLRDSDQILHVWPKFGDTTGWRECGVYG
jgi:hypothetical protein